jgi:hypothetical protein
MCVDSIWLPTYNEVCICDIKLDIISLLKRLSCPNLSLNYIRIVHLEDCVISRRYTALHCPSAMKTNRMKMNQY